MSRLFFIFLLLTFGCTNNQTPIGEIINKDTSNILTKTTSITNSNIPTIDTFLLGDINFDKKTDTAFIINPKFKNEKDPLDGGCIDDCSITVNFSSTLPSFHFVNAIGGGVYNLGDIDKDGVCELMFIPAWFQGCWGQMHFYTLKNKSWVDFGQAGGYLCTEEDYKKRVRIINKTTIEVIEDIIDNGGDRIQKPKRLTLRK